MARLRDEPKSDNFEDKTVWGPRDYLNDFLYRTMWNYMPGYASRARKSGKFSPEENDAHVAKYSKPSPVSKMTVNDFSPEEWRLVKERGFSLEDLLVMRGAHGSARE